MITDEQRMACNAFYRTFGLLREGRVASLPHENGGTVLVSLHECRQEGDEFVFRLEILAQAEGSA